MTDLVANARALFASDKGILAADESVATADKRLQSFGIAPGDEMRRLDRVLFLNAPGIEEYLSGVILFEETFGQKGSDRKLFRNSLAERGIAPGIKVDQGTEPFAGSPKELITNGLLGLPERLKEFAREGAVFAKWRAVVTIDGDTLPSGSATVENAKRLASYAKCAQVMGLVPIIEPEVLLAGKHSRVRAKEVLTETLSAVFAAIEERHVDRASVILKTAMVLSGSENAKKDMPEDVAADTLEVLLATVPSQVAGIVFLSGGQAPDQATNNLRAICKLAKERNAPWPITFSYSRAIQDEALALWQGEEANLEVARAAYLQRLKLLCAAVKGEAGAVA